MEKVISYIQDVRSRPEAERDRFVIFWTVVIMIVLVAFWIFDFTMIAGQGVETVSPSAVETPLGIMKTNLETLYREVIGVFNRE